MVLGWMAWVTASVDAASHKPALAAGNVDAEPQIGQHTNSSKTVVLDVAEEELNQPKTG